jgi:hypothetical protein
MMIDFSDFNEWALDSGKVLANQFGISFDLILYLNKS